MNINKIIAEEIQKYITEKNETEKRLDDIEKEKHKKLSDTDTAHVSKIIRSGLVNISAIAKAIKPDLTKGGAESEIRKKAFRTKSDSGSRYGFTKKETNDIQSILNKHIN